jgi:hypothetical protein
MANEIEVKPAQIVIPVKNLPKFPVSTTGTKEATTPVHIGPGLGQIFHPVAPQWAPAWFYSALCWLAQTYSDASNTEHGFGSYLVGSNVDPYQSLGATRLFVIEYIRGEFFLSLAPDADSDAIAGLGNGAIYQKTDAGILQLYQDLAASEIFSSVTHCYVPGRVDLVPRLQQQLNSGSSLTGYDPATGLRRTLMGSAISQVVPLSDFEQVANQQVYDESPAIVPIATSLVYDVATNNAVGATTFVLPVAYIVDQPTPGQYYVSCYRAKLTGADGAPTANAFDYGQTAVFENGPGYDAAKATQLAFVSKSEVVSPVVGLDFITTNYQASVAHSSIAVGNAVVTGVSALTYSSRTPLSVFENQRIAGFYRENSWNNSQGYPIFDYQAANSSFIIAQIESEIAPVTIYNPTTPFLNGGTLPNVLAKIAAATFVYTSDALSSLIEEAGAYSVAAAPAGLSVMSATLDISMSSNPSAGLTNQLTVPIVATVTTTPVEIVIPTRPGLAARGPTTAVATSGAAVSAAAAGSKPTATGAAPGTTAGTTASATTTSTSGAARVTGITSRFNGGEMLIPIGQNGNNPTTTPPTPSQVKVEMDAFIPVEALAGTGIIDIPIGTAFPAQSLGDGKLFESNSVGAVVNLSDANRDIPPLPTIELPLTDTSLTLVAGIQYVFSLQGPELSVRGSDGTAQSATPALGRDPDTAHVYVGAILVATGLTGVTLYPVLSLTLSAPAVSISGVTQGETYSVCLTYGPQECSLDILDSDQIVIAPALTAPAPQASDDSKPQAGDIYFGSFVGGAAQMTVWAVPVFLPVSAAMLPAGTSFDGAMSLVAATTGVPAYSLQITDSSLFIFTNINVDSWEIGSVSKSNVYVAGVAINSAPDDLSSKAFAPTGFVLGLVRQAQVGTVLRYVFIPETDSVIIGGKRYMLSAIQLEDLTDDPRQRPYPPNYWPDWNLWQFANRHNPYLDIRYEGTLETDRIAQAQADTAAIAAQMQKVQEPLQMYLDTSGMTVWPILAFPNATATAAIDQSQFQTLAAGIVDLLQTELPVAISPGIGALESEQVVLPTGVGQNNPYTYGVDFNLVSADVTPASSPAVSASVAMSADDVVGLQVTNLSPGVMAGTTAGSLQAQFSLQRQQSQQAQVDLAETKANGPQVLFASTSTTSAANLSAQASALSFAKEPLPIYGFSVYNPSTGECYLIELVPADLTVSDQLPNPTQNATYDPYYVRVVFLQRRKAYNMSIVVPSIAYDQYGRLATPMTPYANLVAKTDDFAIGYVDSLYDATGIFDTIDFEFPSVEAERQAGGSRAYVYTNLAYVSPAGAARLAIALIRKTVFACRRENWNAACKLMVATRPENTHLYLAFGGGDLVPMRLDDGVDIDKRIPAHMYNLTSTFSDLEYIAVKTIDVANVPYVISVGSVNGLPVYSNFSIDATAGTADLQLTTNQTLDFPGEIYVVGLASTTLIDIDTIQILNQPVISDSGGFYAQDDNGIVLTPEFQVIPYNNLVYLVRAVSNSPQLSAVGGLGCTSGLLIDTYVPATTGNFRMAQAARYKRSGLQFFGDTYTPTTMVDSLDTLDFTSITGQTFQAPTIFIPIPELDAAKGFVANISNFIGQQFWTFIYPEIIAQRGDTVNGVAYPDGFNLDNEGKPILSLQKLHFVYDPLAVLCTPNDLAHKYALQPKQQVLALTNGQIQDGICWRTDNVHDGRTPPRNVCAQRDLPDGWYMDRPNIIYSSHNRAVQTSTQTSYLGMSVNSIRSVSGTVYNIEESGLSSSLSNDQVGGQLISTVSSIENMLIAVMFDYDNNDLGDLESYDDILTNKGVVLLNGYLGASGFNFSSPDHFDVNDVLPSQVPWLDMVADIFGYEVAFYNTDLSLPRQFWSLSYDGLTGPGLPNYIASVPPSIADPSFSNRTRSLLLNFENQVRPQALGAMDTLSSVVSINLHLQNGVTGSIFMSKKADRDVVSIGTNPIGTNSFPLAGLPTKYDFFIFTRDHYYTLFDGQFDLIDQGYAMCLVDDGTGTGNKVAKYFVDSDGNYNELYTYVLYSPENGILETNSFALKVTLGSPANLSASPIIPETPNNVNPQDLVAQINKLSNLVYAVSGASSPGQPPAFIPIQAVGTAGVSEIAATPISGQPGFSGYNLNVLTTAKQPAVISRIFSANVAYPIAGPATIQPFDGKKKKPVPFCGSLSHGLDAQVQTSLLQSADKTSYLPRTTSPAVAYTPLYGGNGQGSLIGTPFSLAFQGSGAIPPAIAADPTPGTVMKADDSVFYTFNAVTNNTMDSTGKAVIAAGGQYFVDTTDPANPVYVVVSLPTFVYNSTPYTVNLSTTRADGITPQYTLIAGGKSFPFELDNFHVTVDRSLFTFNGISNGVYTVSVSSIDAPAVTDASPISLTPFTITGGGLPPGGQTATVDVFNEPGNLQTIVLGVTGRIYGYDPIHGTVTVTEGSTKTVVPIKTGLVFASSSSYGYVIGFEQNVYTVNGSPMFPYTALSSGSPASYPLMTAPQMFTRNGNFYTFDVAANGSYVSITGNGHTYPVNPYQFSITGEIYIINTNVQPNTVIGGGFVIPMTANNSQFVLDGVQYTIALKAGSLSGATISGQFNIAQGNVVVIEDFVYLLDTLNGQIVGNGTTYPLTTSGFTYTISTANNSFTVTTEANAETVQIGDVVYQINNSTVVGDGITYPILPYRTFTDEGTPYNIGIDGTVVVSPTLKLAAGTFTDSGQTYTVNQTAAFDGTNYYPISTGTPPVFTAAGITYQLRLDAFAVTVGAGKTFFVNTGAPNLNQVKFGAATLFYGRASDNAAFDGTNYFAIVANQFTDSNTGKTYTLSGNTAVCAGNSYEIYSNLGQGGYFEVHAGPTYYVNVSVADFGSATGDIYSVFPITAGSFVIPLVYTLTISGSDVSVNSSTFGASTPVASLAATAGSLTGGFFTDPVTGIVYNCIRDGEQVSFVDSNNNVYLLPLDGTTFTALVPVGTAVGVAVDNQATPNVYPVLSNSFIAGAITYTVNVPVAYQNGAASYWPMVNQRFIVPQPTPASSLAYRVVGSLATGSVIRGYLVSEDDEFSLNGKVVYTVNEVNVVKANNQATLTGTAPNQTVTLEGNSYVLDAASSTATTQPAGLQYNTVTKQFTITYASTPVIYTVSATTVTDSRKTPTAFSYTPNGSIVKFTDTVSGTTFSFDSSGDNPISVQYVYESRFFIDTLNGITYYVDTDATPTLVEAISYLPETTRYAFTPADGNTYLIHYNDVEVVFPVTAGANVNAGVATVGLDIFTLEVDEVDPAALAGPGATTGPQVHLTNNNAFEINGDLYTITGAPVAGSYLASQVVGAGMAPFPFTGASTFKLSDPAVTYTLHVDPEGVPETITATFAVQPSQDVISVGDEIYIITYGTVTTGSLLGQGQSSIPILNSAFTLSNPFDTTKAKFIFADANIYDAGSVVGQFTVYLAPTFFIDNITFTLDPVNLVVTDGDKRPYPIETNPKMFSINGFNYLIDTNSIPHAIVGNNNVSPLATDVTVQAGQPIPNSAFTLNGQVYAYTEDSAHNLLTITGTKSYMIAQPELTFKLDSSLLFTLSLKPPPSTAYVGPTVPIGTVTSGSTILNVYAGTAESGSSDFFTYKNVLYTLVKSGVPYVAVQKSYTVYVSKPTVNQQQLAVFDMNGMTYLVTDGTTAGVGTAGGINPGSLWSATAVTNAEAQLGQVYGLAAQPTNVVPSGDGKYQFPATDTNGNTALLDIIYAPGATNNQVVPDTPKLLPSFTQTANFTFLPAYAPLTFETGGYSAFTSAVEETATPVETFSAAWNTPIVSTDDAIGDLITPQGDFSIEFWHSVPRTPAAEEHVFTYVSTDPLVSYVDIDFLNSSAIQLTVNDTAMQASTTPPVFTSGWRHVALAYTQPYMMLCQGAPFTVADGSDFNFERDFTIAMTISVGETGTTQGLLYKGTGSDIPAPQTQTSFRVTLNPSNQVVFEVVGSDNTLNSFTGPALDPTDYYQVLITKHTKTPMGDDTADSDPYSPPAYDPKAMAAAPQGPTQVSVNDGSIAIGPTNSSATAFENFASSIKSTTPDTGYIMSIAIRKVFTNGTYDAWTPTKSDLISTTDAGLLVMSTGSSNLLIGGAYDDNGAPIPFGTPSQPGSIREVYLFASAIRTAGIRTGQGFVKIDQATDSQLQGVGLVGWWRAAYDPNGIVSNLVNDNAFAASSNGKYAILAPLPHHESEGIALYVNGSPVTLSLLSTSTPSPFGWDYLAFNAGTYRIQEISVWNMARQQYQVINDMFGQLIPSNEPFLALYLPGSFSVDAPGVGAPLLPMANYIEDIKVQNQAPLAINLGFASLDLQGCPAIGKCGPLISPNLYTPPGVALTVCDSVPDLTTYSITLNTVTGTLAGQINEAYVFIRNQVLTLYAGKKVGDLQLVWVSQEQGDVQVMGYIEGAPPAPMANLTNKSSYAGATSVSFTSPISLSYKFQTNSDSASSKKGSGGASGNYQDPTPSATTSIKTTTPPPTGSAASDPKTEITTTITDSDTNADGVKTETTTNSDGSSSTTRTAPQGGGGSMHFTMSMGPVLAALGFGLNAKDLTVKIDVSADITVSGGSGTGTSQQETATEKLDESNKYTVRLEGATTPYTGDTFMASLNSLTTPSTTPGTPASKTPILPDPNLGGFTVSNPPGALPKAAPTEERLGQRMFMPSPYGQAFVTSRTLDVYQQILLQTKTTFGFIRIPDMQIPRDINILSFRMSSKYIRPGCLDGVIGYQYNPATLASGAETWLTSTGQLSPLYDGNFLQGEVGHNASYMRVVEAYQIKKQIDQQAFNALALYATAYGRQTSLPDTTLTPALDFYNEYVWSSRGGTQEVKHTYTTNYEEVYLTTKTESLDVKVDFNAKFSAGGMQVLGLSGGFDYANSSSNKWAITYAGTSSFDVAASFDGIENDTQMRYASNNDAHFLMNFNSTFNPSNQSGLNLVAGSDGLVYQIVPSVTSGAGLPTSDNLDTSFTYQQPQPSYATGNADGLTGNLEPYDRPGKSSSFRTYAFFLQPAQNNADDFWNTVVDPNWLANSPDPDATALRTAQGNASQPWRLLYRVTDSERFLPPISNVAALVPQITPVFAVPVTNPVTDLLFQQPGSNTQSPLNPHNDVEANIVLVVPTSSGLSLGSISTSGSSQGLPVPPNNVIAFDLVSSLSSIVNWGDTANTKLLTNLTTSALAMNTIPMQAFAPAGSTKSKDVLDLAGNIVYSAWTDPNGLTIYTPQVHGVIVYQDVNGNPIQYFDGKTYQSLQADYIPTVDGTVTYYIQPPSTYDQTTFSLVGDDDLYGSPGDQWRYYLVSGCSSKMTAGPTVKGLGPFMVSGGYTGFTIADTMHDPKTGARLVQGYVLVQGMMEWPNLNVAAESFADVQVYKSLSVLDTFPIGDPAVLESFLAAQYSNAPFVNNDEINLVFTKNITSFFNSIQQSLIPQ